MLKYSTPVDLYSIRASALLSRLEGVIRRSESSWCARCPAHEDRSPSLSVTDTGEKVLINCFAGCATEDVLAAVGLTFRSLYPGPWRASYTAATACRGHRSTRRMMRDSDPLEFARLVLRIAAENLRAGKTLSTEDARVEAVQLRLEAVAGRSAA